VPNARGLLALSDGGDIRLWDPKQRRVVARFDVGGNIVRKLSWVDDRWLVAKTDTTDVLSWDTSGVGAELYAPEAEAWIGADTIADVRDTHLKLISPATKQEVGVFDLPESTLSAVVVGLARLHHRRDSHHCLWHGWETPRQPRPIERSMGEP
jgi:hypothetical protein